MNWSVVAGIAAGFVGGVNLGVLLMVALQAGRRQDRAYDEGALLARIQDLEVALARHAQPAVSPANRGPIGIVDEPPTADHAGKRRVTG